MMSLCGIVVARTQELVLGAIRELGTILKK